MMAPTRNPAIDPATGPSHRPCDRARRKDLYRNNENGKVASRTDGPDNRKRNKLPENLHGAPLLAASALVLRWSANL